MFSVSAANHDLPIINTRGGPRRDLFAIHRGDCVRLAWGLEVVTMTMIGLVLVGEEYKSATPLDER